MSKYLLLCIILVFLIYFITISNISAEPIIIGVSPEDGAKLDSNPTLIINISNDFPLNIIWYFKEKESDYWEKIGENTSVISGIYQQNIPNGTFEGTNYQWKINISDSNNSIERIYNFRRRGWQQVFSGWFTGGNWSITLYNRTIAPLYTPLTLTILESAGRIFNIEWKTNASGEWITFAKNVTCSNGTYSQIATWANESKKTYWWKFKLEGDEGIWESNTFNFTTETYSWGDWSDVWVFTLKLKEAYVKSFTPLSFELSGISFSVSLDIVLENYSKNLTLDISTRDFPLSYTPENMNSVDGRYLIRDLYIPASGDNFWYPFDKYNVNIGFITEDGRILNLSGLKSETESTSLWKMSKTWNENNLELVFERNQEVSVFYILILLAIGSITTSIFYLKKSKSNYILYINEIIGIPFFFGVIFNYIVYDIPSFLSVSFLLMLTLFFISLLLGALVYNSKLKLKD